MDSIEIKKKITGAFIAKENNIIDSIDSSHNDCDIIKTVGAGVCDIYIDEKRKILTRYLK